MLTDAEVRSLTGLSEAEAEARLVADGPNELPASRGRNILAIAFEVMREPMFLLLAVGGSLYLVLGELSDALMLLFFVFVVMGITIYQERKTERALEALRDLSSPRALVIRGGEQRRISGREVVRGDIMILSEGDRVPADALLLWTRNLTVDESLLTGESAAVRKRAVAGEGEAGRPGGEDRPGVWSGTLVVGGQGVAEVRAVGSATEMGKIGKTLAELPTGRTPLQEETNRLVKRLAFLGLSFCTLVVVVFGATRGDWLKGILAGLAMAMAVLPEEFPVVLVIFLTLGAWRMSKRRVLTRRVPAVEALGSATVLCVDKTGTLTLNAMSVARIWADGCQHLAREGGREGIPEACHEVLEYGILASKRDPFDPMEKAIRRLGVDTLAETEHLHEDWDLVLEYPLSHRLLALSRVWKTSGDGPYVVAAKGAPEAVADLCHLPAGKREMLTGRIRELAGEGLRVIGVARARFPRKPLPSDQHDFSFEFLGLIGMADPVRESVPGAVAECYLAGIRVVMITGDYPETARHIAREIGLRHPEEVLTGPELERMGKEELSSRVRGVDIFARVLPEQKLFLVQALQAAGEVVAMTGDGVNDAPALRAAHIGVAMGGRGTDVAREAASLVLLDDDFTSIVSAVRQGRRIFDNLRKAMAYIMAVHVPIAGLSLFPVLLGWPLILLPVHIVFLELIIDPACSVVFEAEGEEKGVMERPPRRREDPLFNRKVLTFSLLQGAMILAVLTVLHWYVLSRGQGEAEARSLTFTTLVFANLGLIVANRSWSRTFLGMLKTPNAALWWVVVGALGLLAVVLVIPPLRELFHFSVLHPRDLVFCLAAAAAGIGWFEILKLQGVKPLGVRF